MCILRIIFNIFKYFYDKIILRIGLLNLKKFIGKNKVFLASVILYITATLYFALTHVPLFDESHAWRVAEVMSTNNWLYIMKVEGHPILWFLILMPWAKFSVFYPLPMIIINYVSCLLSVILLWKKAPFNNLIKIIITFSAMFLLNLPIVTRGYSTGILFLFLLCALFKHQLKHPFIYALLIGLALNLNIMTAVGGIWFGCVFVYNILKSGKMKEKIISLSILFFSSLFTLPLLFATNPTAVLMKGWLCPKNIITFFTEPAYYTLIIYITLIAYLLYKLRNKLFNSFLIFTSLTLLYLFTSVYPCFYHHFIFFFIFIIIYMWLAGESSSIFKSKNIVFSALLALLIVPPINHDLEIEKVVHHNLMKNPIKLIKTINSEPVFQNSRIYIHGRESYIIPYINKDIEIYDLCHLKPISAIKSFEVPKECILETEEKIIGNTKKTFIISREFYFGDIIGEFEDFKIYKIK